MNNDLNKFAKKILFQDKILRVLVFVVVVAPPLFLIPYGIIYSSSAIDLQIVLFMFSIIYLIFFMFLSYEYIYKLRSYSIIECVNTTNQGCKSIVKRKILLLCIIAGIEALLLILLYSIFALFDNILTVRYLIYIILSIVLNIFLLCVAGIFIGAFVALKMKRIAAYLLMIFITVMTSRVFDILWVGLYSTTGIDLFKITGLFQLTTPSTNWTPNAAFGYSILPYRFAIVLFWIIISYFGIIVSLHQINKRKFKAIISIIMIISCLSVYFIPSSKVVMDQRNIEGPNADYDYYDKYQSEIIVEDADFNITDLNMTITSNLLLKSTARIKVDNKKLEKYRFTLYHGYDIKSIKINNENVGFDRHLDYFEINNSRKTTIDTITIDYSGYSTRYYSNIQGAILPGLLPFYPMAGYREVYSIDHQSFVPNHSNEYINFDIKVLSINQFYSNLNETDNNHFTGSAKSLTLVSGMYKSVIIGNTKVIYPYPDTTEMSLDIIMKYVNEFKKSNIDESKVETIILVPSLNQGRLERLYTDETYIVSSSIVDIQNDYVESFIDKNKLELYYCIDAFKNDNEYYQEIKEYFDFATLFENNIQKYGWNKVYEECNEFLFNSKDKRTIDSFLKDLLEVK